MLIARFGLIEHFHSIILLRPQVAESPAGDREIRFGFNHAGDKPGSSAFLGATKRCNGVLHEDEHTDGFDNRPRWIGYACVIVVHNPGRDARALAHMFVNGRVSGQDFVVKTHVRLALARAPGMVQTKSGYE